MKKLIACIAVFGLYFVFGGKKVHAWNGFTHEDITKKALALLEKENKNKAAAFYKDWHKQIILGSKQPDHSEDHDNGAGTHYYSCVNAKGKELPKVNNYYVNRLGKAMRSARTLFEENYTCAVNLYKSGDTSNAMRYLGRAIHFIEDMSCTVHTANMMYLDRQNNIHFAFEKRASAICTKHSAEKFDKRLTKYYEKADMGEALNKLVEYAGRFTKDLCNKEFEKVAAQALPYSQQNVMALLIKFYNDCQEDRGNFLADGKEYTFINAATKEVMNASAKGIILEGHDQKNSQKLQICLSDQGTFGLKIFDGGYVNDKLKGYDYLKIGTKPAQFRAAAVDTRTFRISTEKSGYKRVISGKKGGKLCIEKFQPGKLEQLWIIK